MCSVEKGTGDIFLIFSVVNPQAFQRISVASLQFHTKILIYFFVIPPTQSVRKVIIARLVLLLAYNIVTAHGHELRVENKERRETTFIVGNPIIR